MSRRKEKLVLKRANTGFIIAKSINTLDFGVPGAAVTKEQADRILISKDSRIRSGELTVEFIS